MINAKEQVIIGEYTATMHGVVAATVIRNLRGWHFPNLAFVAGSM